MKSTALTEPPLQVSGNWMNFPYKRCFDASLLNCNYHGLPALCGLLCPCYLPQTHHTHQASLFFFSWGQINQVPSNRFFILKKGNKKRGHKGRLGPLCKLNTSRLSLAKKKKKKEVKKQSKTKPPHNKHGAYAKWHIKVKRLDLWAHVVFLGEDSICNSVCNSAKVKGPWAGGYVPPYLPGEQESHR